MRGAGIALVALVASAAAGCAGISSHDGAILRFESGGLSGGRTQEVPFEGGGMLGVSFDHSPVWREGSAEWSGRKASRVVEPRSGERVVVRTVYEAVGGSVVSTDRETSVLRMDRPLRPGDSGAGAWIGESAVVGVVIAGDREDPRTVLVRRPATAPAGVAMVRSADREGVEVAGTR